MNVFCNRRRAARSGFQNGFTLTEVAVALAILAVLAGILLPVYAAQKGSPENVAAMQGECAMNEKQISIAILAYAQDYDERFPPPSGSATVAGGKKQIIGWGATATPTAGDATGVVFVYVRDAKPFHCPAGPKDALLSYRYNDLLTFAKMVDVASLAQTVLLTDGENLTFNVGHGLQAATSPAATDTVLNAQGRVGAEKGALVLPETVTRHGGGANYAFADGHIKWFRPEAIFFPPQASAGRVSFDPKTKRAVGPTPGGAMRFGGKTYQGTFHLR